MTPILIAAVLWKCTVVNAGTGEVFSATSSNEQKAMDGAMNRCYFFSGEDDLDCIADRCEQVE